MTDFGSGDVREVRHSVRAVLAALAALLVVLLGLGDGLGRVGLLPLFAGLGSVPSTPFLEGVGVGVLVAGTALAVYFAAARCMSSGSLFGRVWGGVLVSWTAACGLVSVTTGNYTFGEAFVSGALAGAVRGVMLGWVIAVVAVVTGQRIASKGKDAGLTAAFRHRRWRPGPYLIITGVIFGPLGAVAIWALLFLSPERAPDCIDWCVSDRGGTLFMLFLVTYVAIPAWALWMGALGVLRLIPAVRNWPVIGQVAVALMLAAALGGPVGAAWLTG